METKKKCVFAGSFDPPTLGHKAIVQGCLKAFDEVVVALLVNPAKTPFFTTEERLEMLRIEYADEPRVRVRTFSGTVSELLKEEDTDVYVRGLRNSTDFDFENANFYASRKLDKEITAFYLPCPQELLHVSSSLVRSSLHFQTPIGEYVSKEVEAYIAKKHMVAKR